MKKILTLLITLLTLTACGNETITMQVNDPLEYSVNIKDNAEFILIKEGTSIKEATKIIEDHLDIETNADSYEFDWYGEAYSAFTRDDLQALIDKYGENASKILQSRFLTENDKANIKLYEHLGDTNYEKEATLNHDSFRPIELIIDFTKNNETETYYKQILLCVAEDEEYNAITNNSVETVEDAYRTMHNSSTKYTYNSLMNKARNEGYFSNIKQANGYLVGDEWRYSTSSNTWHYYPLYD